jgi:hypothetical protein
MISLFKELNHFLMFCTVIKRIETAAVNDIFFGKSETFVPLFYVTEKNTTNEVFNIEYKRDTKDDRIF